MEHPSTMLSNNCKTSFTGPQSYKIFLNIRDGELFFSLTGLNSSDGCLDMDAKGLHLDEYLVPVIYHSVLDWD